MKSKITWLGFWPAFLLTACSSSDSSRGALASLIQAEREFAQTSVTRGVGAAFLANLADSAIVFRPHPVNGPAVYRDRPDAPITLNWRPVYADISAAGDFGYTTGPWEITDNSPQKRPPAYGDFFSVWRKQTDGNWKVILDFGIANAEPVNLSEACEFSTHPRTSFAHSHESAEIEQAKQALLQLERSFSEAAARGLWPAYETHLNEETRLLRSGDFPITDKMAMHHKLAQRAGTMTWQPLRVEMAQSLDLAYTLCAYACKTDEPATVASRGYSVRVWKRQESGSWKVVLDVENILPPEAQSAGD